MKLSNEASEILQSSYRQCKTGEDERKEIEALIERMPDDRVLLYKNIMSNPIGDLPRYSSRCTLMPLRRRPYTASDQR